MPDYRHRVPGSTYFFTVNLLERRTDLLTRHIDVLLRSVAWVHRQRPFHIEMVAMAYSSISGGFGSKRYSCRVLSGLNARKVGIVAEGAAFFRPY